MVVRQLSQAQGRDSTKFLRQLNAWHVEQEEHQGGGNRVSEKRIADDIGQIKRRGRC